MELVKKLLKQYDGEKNVKALYHYLADFGVLKKQLYKSNLPQELVEENMITILDNQKVLINDF